MTQAAASTWQAGTGRETNAGSLDEEASPSSGLASDLAVAPINQVLRVRRLEQSLGNVSRLDPRADDHSPQGDANLECWQH